MYKPYGIHLFSYECTYLYVLPLIDLVTKVKPEINSIEIHP